MSRKPASIAERIFASKAIRFCVLLLILVSAFGYVGRHHRLRWVMMMIGIRPSSASALLKPKIGTAYPDAGWIPYKKGPFVTTVSDMYGSTPLTSCKLAGGLQGTCLTNDSAAIIANLWGQDPFDFDTMQMVLGGTDYYKHIYEKNAVSANAYFESTGSDPEFLVTCDASGYPALCDRGSVHIPPGAVPETSADHHLFVRDRSTGIDWQSWVSPIPTGRVYQPYTANSQPASTSEGIGFGGTAGNIATAWSVRPQDILVGRIPHALMIRVTCDTTKDGTHGSYVYPVMVGRAGNAATDNNYFCGTPNANGSVHEQWRAGTESRINLEYGAHLWSDVPPSHLPKPTADGSNGCDPIAYAELRALNEFGGFVSDVGSAKYFHGPMYIDHSADINDTYTGNPNGTHSYWQDLLEPLTGEEADAMVSYALKGCGVNLAEHLHVLIPPAHN